MNPPQAVSLLWAQMRLRLMRLTGTVDRKIKVFDGAIMAKNFPQVAFLDIFREALDDDLGGSIGSKSVLAMTRERD